jgi:hypothetical protein
MKKIIFTLAAIFCLSTVFSQTISKITLTGNGQVDVFAFGLDENVQVYISKTGTISKWGFDRYIGYQENYNGDLQPYVGRTELYTQNEDEALRGKIKYIGRTLITYFASYENEELRGKVKSIGSINLDYYQSFEDVAYRGNIKMLGNQPVTWYASYENADIKGKLKNIGPTSFTYYGSFEDKAFRGKIKSIDRYSFIYYSSFEQYSGSLKNGASIINANGIKYYLRNY